MFCYSLTFSKTSEKIVSHFTNLIQFIITLTWLCLDACLKMTGVKLDVFSEKQNDMYLMVERGIRGGISVISHRHSKANNKYLPDFNPKEASKYIVYRDANNLYGWAMIQPLATGNFKWENVGDFNE